jgi:DMSO/TMAO reductase YedYZ molybdopterin-dependent catalytic subunit
LNRREFIQRGALSLGAPLLPPVPVHTGGDAFAGGEFIGLVEFVRETSAPLGVPINSELDERMYVDLSRVSEQRLTTSTSEFYIRTGASPLLPDAGEWKIQVSGLVEQPFALDMRALRKAAKPMGLHLMECAGNGRLTHFGLMSTARWDGVLLSDILKRIKIKPEASRVLISGFDEYTNPPVTSVPGASWIFQMEQLSAAKAFLATAMNGQPLIRDHGAPVRLVVPGWYGCACIKWLNSIEFVDEDAEATSQMREFAARTLQQGVPQLARDYAPASIDHAAIPVRIEKWRVRGKLKYRITGILWGGSQLVKTLQIRFRPDQDFFPVDISRHTANDPWTIWTYAWSPLESGLYTIRMAVTEPVVQTRKLASGYYDRSVEMSEL